MSWDAMLDDERRRGILQRRRILAHRTKVELITIIATGCPTCQTGPGRETTGMVCQYCGMDYATTEHEIRRQSND